jgi:hypothetical protein
MKKVVTALVAVGLTTSGALAQAKKELVIQKRAPVTATAKKTVAFNKFQVTDAKSTDGKKYAETDVIKTISGKSITVGEYLKRVNNIEAEMNKKGYTLRNFNPGTNNLLYKPVILEEARINTLNTEINRNSKPLMNLQANNNKVFMHSASNKTLAIQRVSTLKTTNPAAFQKLIGSIKLKTMQPETIEKTHSIKNLLKPLADKIQAELDNDDAEFQLANADLVVRTYAEPPKAPDGTADEDLIGTTNSEYKVAVTFGATMKVSLGLPINFTLPLATMNGEFIAPSNKTKKLSRKVVVNLVGRSLFNKSTTVNGNTLDEEDSQELDISELLSSVPMNATNFLDWIPSIGFNTDLSNSGAVGCMYKADMTRSNVDAYIGPTYSVRLRVAASYGMEDVAEGGIEGIVTLLKGGLGFGGNAGLDYDGTQWKAINKAYVESTLEALKGEINFFVRYPDLGNWSCFGPCIKKETFPLFKTPTAFKLTGTLLEDDKSKVLTW